MRVFTHKTNIAFLFLCATGEPVLCRDSVWKLLLLRIEGCLQEKPPDNDVKWNRIPGWWRVCSHRRLHTVKICAHLCGVDAGVKAGVAAVLFISRNLFFSSNVWVE